MATIDIVIPTYRGMPIEANTPLIQMMQSSNCFCRDRDGMPIHQPWECPKGKHSVRLVPPIHGSSVVHWSRNQSVARAMYGQAKDGRPPADYFLLMDDDMVCEPHYLTRLASYKADIICGICTIRRDPPQPNIRFWNPDICSFNHPIEWEWDSQKLMEIDAAGAAFMLVKREVFVKMGNAYLDCLFEMQEDHRKLDGPNASLAAYWDRKSAMRWERFEKAIAEKKWMETDCWWFQFLTNVVDGQIGELGEDLSFCWKAKKLGYKIYADPQVLPGHLGTYSYSIRDYREYVEQMISSGQMPQLQDNHAALGV